MEKCRTQEAATLNETIFLATYAVGILAEEIGTAIERIDDWLGKPVVLHAMRLPQHNFPMCLNVCNISMDLNQLFLITELMIYILTCFRGLIVVTAVR